MRKSKKKIIKVDKKAFKKIPKFKVTLPKCKHKWETHRCNCGLCDVYGLKICYECGGIK